MLAAGCGHDDPEHLARRTIGSEGGQISSKDGVLTIAIPPGALDRPVTVQIVPSDTPPEVLFGAYRVQPDIPLRDAAVVTYRKGLPTSFARVRVAAIGHDEFAHGSGHWRPLPLLELDPRHGLVSGTDRELSLFYAAMEIDDSGSGSSEGTDGDDSLGTDGSTSSGETDARTETVSSDSTGYGPLSHALDIQPLWDAHCLGGGCHEPVEEGGNPTAAVRLGGDAYPAIVDVFPAVATVPYVRPGSPAESYLMHKLDGTHALSADQGGCGCSGSGVSMPLGQEPLPLATRNLIRAWIEQGAPP